ncbi:MAG: hypothetical protein OEY14_07785 [Myxococcales bacterium]|nr:hypothetical protein [Myxococcales bacterium]
MAAVEAARGYLRAHPEELGRAVRSAFGLRVGVPLAALRWLGRKVEATGKVEGLQIDAAPPGLKIGANLDLMKTPIRASAVIFIDRILFTEEELTLTIRLEEVSLKLNGDSKSPVAMLIQSGALDLKNPGDLVAYLPDRPPILAEARGNRIVLDLMRDPKIGRHPMVRHAVGLLANFMTLKGIEADTAHLDVRFRALPTGFRGAAKAFRTHLVLPSLSRLLPSGR